MPTGYVHEHLQNTVVCNSQFPQRDLSIAGPEVGGIQTGTIRFKKSNFYINRAFAKTTDEHVSSGINTATLSKNVIIVFSVIVDNMPQVSK